MDDEKLKKDKDRQLIILAILLAILLWEFFSLSYIMIAGCGC